MKKITHAVTPGASPFGVHSYTAWLSCSRRAMLTERLRAAGTTDPLGATEPLRIGTLFHYFMDAYEKCGAKSNFNAPALEFTHTNGEALPIKEAERQEAQRLFVAWRAEYWDTPLGATLGSEVTIDDSEAFGLTTGIRPITARLDRVFEIANAATAMKVEKAYGIRLGKGVYVQDYKTSGRRDSHETDRRKMDWQFTLYQLAAQVKFGLKAPCPLIVSTIYKTSTVGFEHRPIPAPTPIQIQGLRDMLRLAKTARESNIVGYNPTACVSDASYIPPCYFFGTGECLRTAAK